MNGWYITGFADGESFFIVRPMFRTTKKGFARIVFSVRWGIQVRADDKEVLEEIKDYFIDKGNCGEVYIGKRKNDISAMARLQYDGIKNCRVVKEHFEEFPLRAKKKHDFELWREIFDRVEASFIPNDKKFYRNYTLDEIEDRLEICRLMDELRVGRLDKSMYDLGLEQLLKRVSGQPKLYTDLFIEYLQEQNVISKEKGEELALKYREDIV